MDKFGAARRKYIETAEKFLRVQELKPDERRFSGLSAETYIKGEEWELAGDIYMRECRYKEAGETYLFPKKYSLAATAFAKGSILLR
jgi:hypothetical protein